MQPSPSFFPKQRRLVQVSIFAKPLQWKTSG
ncbi:hypothetical protein CIPAW_09G083700 [Carya illinoinensis]|uniref:Uncharacterized protein n=1 Tax=Carya illinoinensis TaxID=32201 RepID=A0A8T1PK61_CARIL|nr:hypothetical protein CIPAW_09G083700 [Carya illinoinensis]